MAHAISRPGRTTNIIDGVRGIAANWRDDIRRHREFLRIHDELASLTDRELADIGVARGQIVDVARDASRG